MSPLERRRIREERAWTRVKGGFFKGRAHERSGHVPGQVQQYPRKKKLSRATRRLSSPPFASPSKPPLEGTQEPSARGPPSSSSSSSSSRGKKLDKQRRPLFLAERGLTSRIRVRVCVCQRPGSFYGSLFRGWSLLTNEQEDRPFHSNFLRDLLLFNL